MSQKKLFKKWIAFALALSCVSAAHALPTIGADAGLVPVEVTDAQLEKGVETTYWYATNDVVASSSNGKISFSSVGIVSIMLRKFFLISSPPTHAFISFIVAQKERKVKEKSCRFPFFCS